MKDKITNCMKIHPPHVNIRPRQHLRWCRCLHQHNMILRLHFLPFAPHLSSCKGIMYIYIPLKCSDNMFCLTYPWSTQHQYTNQTTAHHWGPDIGEHPPESHSWKCLSQREHSNWSVNPKVLVGQSSLLQFRNIEFSKLPVGEYLQTTSFVSACCIHFHNTIHPPDCEIWIQMSK